MNLDKLIGNYNPVTERFDGLLKIPRKIQGYGNRSMFPGDVAFLYYVSRNVKWDRLNESEESTGKEYSTNSRIYNGFSNWLYDEWSWLFAPNFYQF